MGGDEKWPQSSRTRKVKELWDGAYSFSSLSLKAGMSKDFVDVIRKAAHSH